MSNLFDDKSLERDIDRLQTAIQDWAVSHHIWLDSHFSTYCEDAGGEPSDIPVVSVLYFSPRFRDVAIYGELENEFSDLIHSRGFEYWDEESKIHFIPEEEPRQDAYAKYLHWKWICSLLQPDFSDVYQELYGHFASRPEDLQRLSWREFEILLARIFQSQGFITELGPGRNDGGIDIRLLQRDPIGDILTLVQAKRYAPKYHIGLEAVAALSGIASVEKAQRSVFVTTSSYDPSAKRFAARTSGALELYAASDVIEWCGTARDGIIEDKSSLVSPSSVERRLLDLCHKPDHRVVHAHAGYNTVLNKFALILKETKHAALLMALPNFTLSGYEDGGTEIPLLDATALRFLRKDTVWRVKRSINKWGETNYWDGKDLYSAWDGKPAYFCHYD